MQLTQIENDLSLFKNILTQIRKDKRILLLPICNFLITITILLTITEPLLRYEKQQWAVSHNLTASFVRIYVALLLFLYLKNTIKGVFTAATCLIIKQNLKQEEWRFNTIWRDLKPCLIAIIKYSTYFSFFGLFYYIYSAIIGYKHERGVFGGSVMQITHFICLPQLLETPEGPRKTLKQSGQLVTKTWGKPPLKLNMSIYTIQWLLFIACLVPATVTLSTANKLNWVVYTGVFLSLMLFICLDVVHKIITQYISYALYVFAKHKQVIAPFSESAISRSIMQVNLNEED